MAHNKSFEDLYLTEVVQALKTDPQLDFKDTGAKYLQKGICPGPKCGQRTLYITCPGSPK